MLRWLPVVDRGRCDGCGACVDACAPRCIEVVDRLAVLVAPDRCDSEEHCIGPCPTTAAIRMAWQTAEGYGLAGLWI